MFIMILLFSGPIPPNILPVGLYLFIPEQHHDTEVRHTQNAVSGGLQKKKPDSPTYNLWIQRYWISIKWKTLLRVQKCTLQRDGAL